MKSIGGFFELELPDKKSSFHPEALALHTGRACIKLILEKIKPSKVYLPFYICNAALAPFEELKISFEFYSIDKNLEPVNLPELKDQEYFFYVNYFDIKNKTIEKLRNRYINRLIIDNSQAFFQKGLKNIYSFNSARKFWGVPDGAYLYGFSSNKWDLEPNTSYRYDHLVKRLKGDQEESYRDFIAYEESLNTSIKGISAFSEGILSFVDYELAINRRKENFNFYHEQFSKVNVLKIDMGAVGVPMIYPLLLNKTIEKTVFYKNKIFIPSYWKDVLERNIESYPNEKELTLNLLPLPLDHRYVKSDLIRLADQIKLLVK